MVLVSAMHITAGVWVNDAEYGLLDDIDEWLEKNPYAVIYAVSMIQKIPAIQNFLSNLTDGFDLSNLQVPAPQAPENTRVLEQYAKEEKAWWQA